MATFAMTLPGVAVSVAGVAVMRAPVADFSSTPSVRIISSSFPAPLRISGAFSRKFGAVAKSSPQEATLTEKDTLEVAVEHAIQEANELCSAEIDTASCANAWDDVEELAAAVAHKKQFDKLKNQGDPLEAFCKEIPEADECRVYED